ncbi:unnamed protein product [Aphanomyces euteiches]
MGSITPAFGPSSELLRRNAEQWHFRIWASASQHPSPSAMILNPNDENDSYHANRPSYYERNRDQVRENQRLYRESNRDKIRAIHKAYYLKNRAKITAYKRERWHQKKATAKNDDRSSSSSSSSKPHNRMSLAVLLNPCK